MVMERRPSRVVGHRIRKGQVDVCRARAGVKRSLRRHVTARLDLAINRAEVHWPRHDGVIAGNLLGRPVFRHGARERLGAGPRVHVHEHLVEEVVVGRLPPLVAHDGGGGGRGGIAGRGSRTARVTSPRALALVRRTRRQRRLCRFGTGAWPFSMRRGLRRPHPRARSRRRGATGGRGLIRGHRSRTPGSWQPRALDGGRLCPPGRDSLAANRRRGLAAPH